jgi:membrane fusion protein, multidrug efflux system
MTKIFVTILLGFLITGCADKPEERDEPTPIPVHIYVVKRGDFQETMTLYGRILSDKVYPLVTPASGALQLSSRFATGLRNGEQVNKDEVLFTITNETVKKTLQEANILLDYRKENLRRAQISCAEGWIAKEKCAEEEVQANLAEHAAQSAQIEYDRLNVKSPFRGYLVVQRHFENAAEVSSGTEIATVIDTTKLHVEFIAPSSISERLKSGQAIVVSSQTNDAQREGSGLINEVSPSLDSSGSAKVIASLEKPTFVIGQAVVVKVILQKKSNTVIVPEEALIPSSGSYGVYLLQNAFDGKYRATFRPVTIGGRDNQLVEVIEGLREGDRVALSGQDSLFYDAYVQEAKK